MRFFKPHKTQSDANKEKDVIKEIERICSLPLPESVGDCAREMQLLADRQLNIGKRLQELERNLAQNSAQGMKEAVDAGQIEQPLPLDLTKGDLVNMQSKLWSGLRHRSKEESEAETLLPPKSNSVDDIKNGKWLWTALNLRLDSNGKDHEQSSSLPLVTALKKLQEQHQQRRTIKTWIYNLANLFLSADVNRNGAVDSEEYSKMVNCLDINDELKSLLTFKFDAIDNNGNGAISLREFLNFFLIFPKFTDELDRHANTNAPFLYENSLSRAEKWRLYLYNIVEVPESSMLAKAIFCIDLVLSIIPAVVVLVQSMLPGYYVNWSEDRYLWSISIIFAIQYIFGLLTCKFKLRYVTNIWHIIDLISFAVWIICNTMVKSWSLNAHGFVLFRALRIFKFAAIFNFQSLKEELAVYDDTIRLTFTSYATVAGCLIYLIFFLSLIMHVVERGAYDWNSMAWIRDEDEGESPFANLYNCVYFTIITMTTVGYGDYSPNSSVGKLTAVIIACCGICNFTLIINIFGQCFEEVFREYALKRSKIIGEERLRYIQEHIRHASETADQGPKNTNSYINLATTECSLQSSYRSSTEDSRVTYPVTSS